MEEADQADLEELVLWVNVVVEVTPVNITSVNIKHN